jgi:hypothetical protein
MGRPRTAPSNETLGKQCAFAAYVVMDLLERSTCNSYGLQFPGHFFGADAGALTGARTLGVTDFVGALIEARTGAFMKLCFNAYLPSG